MKNLLYLSAISKFRATFVGHNLFIIGVAKKNSHVRLLGLDTIWGDHIYQAHLSDLWVHKYALVNKGVAPILSIIILLHGTHIYVCVTIIFRLGLIQRSKLERSHDEIDQYMSLQHFLMHSYDAWQERT